MERSREQTERRSQIRGALQAFAGALSCEISQASEETWLRLFEHYDPEDFRNATLLVLDKWDYNKLPPPAHVKKALRRVRDKESEIAAKQVDCRECVGLGLVWADTEHNGQPARTMTPCACPLGATKTIYLNNEKAEGRAVNRHSFHGEPKNVEPVLPEEEAEQTQDTIPF